MDYQISSGIISSGIILGYHDSMIISSRGTANSTTINSGGWMDISRGGVANSTTVNNWGSMTISSGGVANSTTINSCGDMYISSGGTANSTTINSGGWMDISRGGVANSTTINVRGDMTISIGGFANSTTINSSGIMRIHTGGTATEIVENGGYVHVLDGAYATFASNTIEGVVLSNTGMTVHKNTIANSTTINSGGSMYIYSGGVANSTTINSGGSMYISTGGTANSTTINSSGRIFISSGAIANSTIINSRGNMYISTGGTANSTTINSGGVLIWSGGVANSTTINSGGTMCINLGGVANSTTINVWGSMYISSGGTATEIVENGGYVYVLDGAYATFASNTIEGVVLSNTSMTVHKNTIANNTIINSRGNMSITSGGVANSTTINSSGYMGITSGGTANNTTINSSGYMRIYSGATVNNTTVNSYGSMSISSGGVANNTTINSRGFMSISSGGTATDIIENGGYVYVEDGAYATFASNTIEGVVLSNTRMTVHKNTIANNTTINNGYMYIYSGGVHRGSLQIEAGAGVSVYSGGIIDFTVADRTSADDYLINDLSLIYSAPTYTITVSEDQEAGTYKLAQGASALNGTISICTEDTCFGELTINGEALTYNDITYQLNNADGALTLTVSNGNVVIESEPIFAFGKFNGLGGMFELTVDGVGYVHNVYMKVQLAGTLDSTKWELAGVADFNGCNTDGLLWIEKDTGYVYMQNNLTSFDEVNNKQYCLGVVGEGYEILAAGDFTGTGINGVLMQGPAFGDASVSLNYGLPIWGREADGSTFNGWLGALVNTWQPGDALKGDTSDLADINAQNYMYEVVSVGDYNGDGVDDVMLQNIMPKTVDGVTITGSGDVFTFLTGSMEAVKAGAAPTVAYAGCATDGWEIIGSGDFNGDGIDDVLLSDGTGVAGWQMAYGQQAGNQWFGNLGANEEIAGIADLNNDGTDDIVVLNAATDTYYGWMISNGAISYAVTLA